MMIIEILENNLPYVVVGFIAWLVIMFYLIFRIKNIILSRHKDKWDEYAEEYGKDATFESVAMPKRPPTESFLDLVLFGRIKIEGDRELRSNLLVLKILTISAIIIVAVVVVWLVRDEIMSRGAPPERPGFPDMPTLS